MAEVLFRSLHLLGALGMAAGILVAALAASSMNADRDNLDAADQAALFRKVYGLTAAAVMLSVGAGLMLWLVVGKPAAFFSNNPVFHAKIALVLVMLATLIYPAWYLCRSRPPQPMPASVLRLQKSTFPLLLIVPVLAYLMARGIGY